MGLELSIGLGGYGTWWGQGVRGVESECTGRIWVGTILELWGWSLVLGLGLGGGGDCWVGLGLEAWGWAMTVGGYVGGVGADLRVWQLS